MSRAAFEAFGRIVSQSEELQQRITDGLKSTREFVALAEEHGCEFTWQEAEEFFRVLAIERDDGEELSETQLQWLNSPWRDPFRYGGILFVLTDWCSD